MITRFPWEAKSYRIARQDVCAGLRGAYLRVEQRRDGSVAARFRDRYLRVERCEPSPKVMPAKPARTKPQSKPVKKSDWNKDFDLQKAPKLWQAAQGSGAKREEAL
jgi:hypothetical protein